MTDSSAIERGATVAGSAAGELYWRKLANEEKIEAIRKRAEAATPGPWKTHLVDDTSIVTEDGTDVCTTCDSSQAEREDGYNVEYERMEADAAFIAHARTDIPALLSHIAAQDAEHKAEMLDFIVWVFRDEPVYHLDLGPEGVYAAYLAQKEKK